MKPVQPRALFRDPRFVGVWAIGATTGTIRWLEMLAIGLHTFRVSESALLVSLMFFARIFPPLLLGVLVGALADRVDRRRLYLSGLAVQLVVAGVLAVLAVTGHLALWHIAAGALTGGVFWSMEHPVRRPMVGDAAGPARIGRALSLDSATFNATRMAGPLAGGILFEAVGLTGVYLFSLCLYALAFVVLIAVRPVRSGNVRTDATLLTMLGEGIAIARASRPIAAVLAVTTIVNAFGVAYVSVVPVIGERVLALSAPAVGALMSMEGLGGTIGALALAATVKPPYFLRAFAGGSALVLIAVLAFSVSRSYVVSLGLLLTLGLGLAGFSAMQSAILLATAPAHARSRIMGLLALCIGAQPAGVLHAGLLAEWFGADTALTVISIEGLLALAIAIGLWPELIARSGSIDRPKRHPG
ncbi:MAG: MFS transporter [Gammaproteobacteria bacterium]